MHVIAIATGPFEPGELRDADSVARDARELGMLLEALADCAGA